MIMERKIGEIFEYNGEWYQCVKDSMYDYCRGCASFKNLKCTTFYSNIDCSLKATCKKLEKVGEPYPLYGHIVQRYAGVKFPVALTEKRFINCNEINNTVDIEVKQDKQNKEDMEDLDKIKVRDYTKVEELNVMEEKKLNLKPFDIQKAREGKPVCTRDGRKARIICFNMNSFNNHVIVALITEENGTESIYSYTSEGKWKETETENDLMMPLEKKEGWAVIKRSDIYETEEQAKEVLLNSRVGVMIRKINWEE